MKKLIISILLCVLLIVAVALPMTINAATSDKPIDSLSALETAISNAKDGDIISISGTITLPTKYTWPAKSLTFTGGSLSIPDATISLNGDTTFESITLSIASNTTLYANGHKVVMGTGVTTSTPFAAIYGGGAKGTTVASTDLTILSGSYKNIWGGSNGGTVTGDTNVLVGGTTNNDDCEWKLHEATDTIPLFYVYGGGNADTIQGDTHMTFTGNAMANYIWGGSKGAATIIGDKYATMSGGYTMSFYGGNHYCNTGDGSNNYTLMTGGTLEQLFGGNQAADMKGNIDLRVLGGTVQRRIYGGCYNEATRSGLSVNWDSTNYVTGNIKLTIGGGASITLNCKDLNGNTYDDLSIFARSRRRTVSDEISTLVFADQTAYNNYKNKTGAQDYKAQLMMIGISAADNTHYYTHTASGNTITETCAYHSSYSATATLALDGTTSLVYTGKEIKPCTITYSTGFEGDPFEITYANNVNAGTATATATALDGTTVTLTFQIEKADQSAPVLTATKETVKGKGDGTVSVLTTDMEWKATNDTEFTPVTDTDMIFTPGSYDFRYPATTNYNASPTTTVTVGEGDPIKVVFKADGVLVEEKQVSWETTLTTGDLPSIPAKTGHTLAAPYWNVTEAQLTNLKADLTVEAVYTKDRYTVTLPAAQMGYTLTANTQNPYYGDSVILTLVLAEGYSKTNTFAVKFNGTKIELNADDTYEFTIDGNVTVTVEGVADVTAPTVTVSVGSDSFNILQTQLSDRYYNSSAKISISATDAGTGVRKVEYLFSDTLLSLDALNGAQWQTYTAAFDPQTSASMVYVKVTDEAGNVTYVSTSRIVVDTTAPQISGFTNGATVYGDLTFTVSDNLSCTVKIDGKTVQTYTIAADNATHTVVATDAVGNTTTYTVTVYRIYTVTFKADGTVKYVKHVNHGHDLTDIPAPPEKNGHTSVWDVVASAYQNMQSDLTVIAKFTPIQYTATLPNNPIGYTLSGTGSTVFGERYKITLALATGYNKTSNFAVKINGTDVTLDTDDTYEFTIDGNVTVTVEGVADVTAPTVTVSVGSDSFNTLQAQLSDRYYNSLAKISVSATDAGTGVRKVEYLFSATLLSLDALNGAQWQTYTAAFGPEASASMVYVKVTDEAGNITYVSTSRIVVDTTAPQISGFANGATVYGDLTFTVSDNLSCTVKIDGKTATKTGDNYTMAADNTTHVITVIDAVGNKTIYTVTVYGIYTVTFKADGVDVAVRTVNYGASLTDIPTIPAKTGYTVVAPVWSVTNFSSIKGNLTVNAVYTADPVVSDPPAPEEPDDTPTPPAPKQSIEDEATASNGQNSGADESNTPDTEKTGGSTVIIIVIVAGGCVAVGGGAGGWLIFRKKKKI